MSPKAVLLLRRRVVLDEDAFAEFVLWHFTDPDTLLADFRHDIGSFRDEDRDP